MSSYYILTFPAPYISKNYIKTQINLHFHFQISFGVSKEAPRRKMKTRLIFSGIGTGMG